MTADRRRRRAKVAPASSSKAICGCSRSIPRWRGPNVAEDTFGYADLLRGQSVQRALQASSARSATDNPELANLIRTSQDGEKKIGAAVASLNNLLSLPPEERDEKAVKATQAEITALQNAKTAALKEIAKKFPQYGNLVNPPPPTAADLQKQLADDEAMLSFYFGRFDSFVWVARKGSPVKFSRLKMTLGDLNAKVTKLREALEPKAAMISDIPPFDVKLASELYELLLKPVRERLEAGEEPDRRHQRRARAAAAVAAADRAGGNQDRRRSAVLELSQRAVAGAYACRHHGAVDRPRCRPCASCRPARRRGRS